MKKYLTIIFAFFVLSFSSYAQEAEEIKDHAIALYATENYVEAFSLLNNLDPKDKDEEVFLLLSNVAESMDNTNLAIQNLNKALNKNHNFYKAYYNLGCIFFKKKSYLLAIDNFELAIKYNKQFSSAYYNLASCFIELKDYKNAKKNLIKALQLDPTNKDYLYNLAYCYKKLNQTKSAQKILKTYNKLASSD